MILGSKPEDDRKFMPEDDNDKTLNYEHSEAIQCMHVIARPLGRGNPMYIPKCIFTTLVCKNKKNVAII